VVAYAVMPASGRPCARSLNKYTIASVAPPKTSIGYVFVNALLRIYLNAPVMYPILEPARTWVLSVPGWRVAVFVLVVIEFGLLH